MFLHVTVWIQFAQVLFKQMNRTQVCVYPVLWHVTCSKGLLICLVVFGWFIFCFVHISVKTSFMSIEMRNKAISISYINWSDIRLNKCIISSIWLYNLHKDIHDVPVIWNLTHNYTCTEEKWYLVLNVYIAEVQEQMFGL